MNVQSQRPSAPREDNRFRQNRGESVSFPEGKQRWTQNRKPRNPQLVLSVSKHNIISPRNPNSFSKKSTTSQNTTLFLLDMTGYSANTVHMSHSLELDNLDSNSFIFIANHKISWQSYDKLTPQITDFYFLYLFVNS